MHARLRTIGIAVLALAAFPGGAAAQEITDEGVARSVARMQVLERQCGTSLRLDRSLIGRSGAALEEILQQRVGAAQAARMIAAEAGRMREEFTRFGVQQWCRDVERDYRARGLGDLFAE